MITNCIIVGLDNSAASRTAHRWPAAYAHATGKDLRADETSSPQGSVLEFAQGYVADVLVRLSTGADLLVVGTREPVGAAPT